MKNKYLEKLLLMLKDKKEALNYDLNSINNDDLVNSENLERELLRRDTIDNAIDSISNLINNNASLNNEIELCTSVLILFQKECDELIILSKKVHKYSETILTIGAAKLNSVEYREIANTLNILQKNYDDSKEDLLKEYNIIKELFLELTKNDSNFEAFFNKLNALANKIFMFQSIK